MRAIKGNRASEMRWFDLTRIVLKLTSNSETANDSIKRELLIYINLKWLKLD